MLTAATHSITALQPSADPLECPASKVPTTCVRVGVGIGVRVRVRVGVGVRVRGRGGVTVGVRVGVRVRVGVSTCGAAHDAAEARVLPTPDTRPALAGLTTSR